MSRRAALSYLQLDERPPASAIRVLRIHALDDDDDLPLCRDVKAEDLWPYSVPWSSTLTALRCDVCSERAEPGWAPSYD
jgi:hypothetical protein